MKGKIWHVIFAVAIVVIGIYVYHMVSSHGGSKIIPGL